MGRILTRTEVIHKRVGAPPSQARNRKRPGPTHQASIPSERGFSLDVVHRVPRAGSGLSDSPAARGSARRRGLQSVSGPRRREGVAIFHPWTGGDEAAAAKGLLPAGSECPWNRPGGPRARDRHALALPLPEKGDLRSTGRYGGFMRGRPDLTPARCSPGVASDGWGRAINLHASGWNALLTWNLPHQRV